MKIYKYTKNAVKLIGLLIIAMTVKSAFSQLPEHRIRSFPYSEGFENIDKILFQFNRETFSYVYLDNKAANTGVNGLIFRGSNETTNWVDSSGVTTPLNAWVANFTNNASASVMVDATKIKELYLKFDLKQTFKDRPDHSWFRLLVNGKEVKDVKGRVYSFPSPDNNVFTARYYDLSHFTGVIFKLEFQTCCKSENDCVFIDNISFTNPGKNFAHDKRLDEE